MAEVLHFASSMKYMIATTGRNIANSTELKSMGIVYYAADKRSSVIVASRSGFNGILICDKLYKWKPAAPLTENDTAGSRPEHWQSLYSRSGGTSMDDKVDTRKKDMVNILKFSSQYNISNPATAKKINDFIETQNTMTSPIGLAYKERLTKLAGGLRVEECKCLFCRNNASKDGILCEECMNRYSGGKLSFKAGAPAPEEKKPSSDKTAGNETKKINDHDEIARAASAKVRKGVDKFTEKIHELSGGQGKVDLRLKDLFSDIFHHHSGDEAEEIFICGTRKTTPAVSEISTEWPRPWLYTRVFLLLFVAFLILDFGYRQFSNANFLPGLFFLGSAMVPLSILVFFFEVNAPRNISIFRVIQVFLIGGAASLITTSFLFEIGLDTSFTLIGAFCIGLIEETGKIIVVAVYVMKIRGKRYLLNGMLYGAAVGAGFQVFESAGYAFNYLLNGGFDVMMQTIRGRAIYAPGGHIAYTALAGTALIIALGDGPFTWKVLYSKKFLILFSFSVLLHAFHDWDMPLKNIAVLDISLVLLLKIAVEWIIILVFLHRGLTEINELE